MYVMLNSFTICTALCVAVSGDWDSFSNVIICCKPSGCGSQLILSSLLYKLLFAISSTPTTFLTKTIFIVKQFNYRQYLF